MPLASKAFLEKWHRIIAQRDLEDLATVLATDVTLGAPPYWTKLAGHGVVHHLLGLIVNNIEGFSYHREWALGRELALEFTGKINGLDIQGIDLITLNPRDQIQNLDVLMRPINSVIALRDVIAPQMAEFLADQSTKTD